MSSTLKFKSIVIACDHAAFSAKQQVVQYIQKNYNGQLKVHDLGVHSEDRVDYPDYAKKLCHKLLGTDEDNDSQESYDGGILLCGTGIGISIAANRFAGIRATVCHDHYTAKMAREHNDSNVLCMGARTTGSEVIKEMVDVWLNTAFVGGHHADRVAKIEQ